ncbi:MAG: nuoG [Hydrocarboniphaga sp.]|uniref:NADH-quinone oxidoreductase subunit NuoG n=1 Tax=Hydrocarboniphaga sp. TaxID=2033016 RepID=UPI002617B416|nr:NADH-quinone oxidoreductase subunit NuoG [Hydrocarboniphaga sp.]MDB5969126.1 nuoG [Hydrocarboniphaga sp.]
MASIHVDGKQYEVDGSDNLLHACLSLGLDIPYFCWHPALGSVGACRQCAVKQYADENDKRGRIVMSCMTPAANNSYIAIDDAEAKEFRAAIVSFLMTNHPHDCPVCEEGGHCHLQDMTVMTGHHNRQYHFTKRTHLNQDLGPFIAHEMNRCISCYRCVRFYKDYAGGNDLGVFGIASNVYFGRERPGTLQNEFSGNLSEVCPTGVFTDKTHSDRYVRKWDMQFSPSICASCAVGCNISPGERYGEVRRIENRYHGEINGYFLCDRGRFGYGHVNRKDRPRKAQIRRAGQLVTVEAADALAHVHALLRSGKPVLGIGSPRASLEANAMLRSLVGAQRYSSGMSALDAQLTGEVLKVLRTGSVPAATITAMEDADAVLVLGEDVLATAPRVALALRQAARGRALQMSRDKRVPDWQAYSSADIAQHELNPMYVATPAATRLDDTARRGLRLSPDAIATLGFAIAHQIDPSAPVAAGVSDEIAALASEIAAALRAAKKPLIVSGTGAGSLAVIQAAANVAYALHRRNAATLISLAVPESNSLGVAMFGAQDVEAAIEGIAGKDAVVVIVENDLDWRLPAATVAKLSAAKLVVIDHQMTATTERAEVILPAASFAEGDGTLVNMEGRAQRYFQNFDPAYYDRHVDTSESWRWLDRLRGGAAATENLDAVLAECEAQLPQLKGIVAAAPNASFRIQGMKINRAPSRQSGRTAARAKVFVHEPRSTQDPDTAMSFSMEGYNGVGSQDRPSELLPYAWSPGWNSPQAWNKFQAEVGGAMKGGDSGVFLLRSSSEIEAQGYFPAIPASNTSTAAAGLRVQPIHSHFGSEELSSKAEPIRERMVPATVTLAFADAQRLGIEHEGSATITVDGVSLTLPAKVRLDFPVGLVGIPVGLPGVPALLAGAAASVAKGA